MSNVGSLVCRIYLVRDVKQVQVLESTTSGSEHRTSMVDRGASGAQTSCQHEVR